MYYADYFYLSILLILIGLALLIRFIFSKRYGQSLATKVVIGIFGVSFLIAVITFKAISKDINEQAFPTTEWQQYMETHQSITRLEYRSKFGLYAIQDTGEFQITNKNPFCVIDEKLVYVEPNEIEITDSLLSELPQLPQPAIHQINFILKYPETDEAVFSSFAVFESGEIWCTERYMRGGLGGAVAIGFLGLAYLVFSALFFLGSLILLLVLSIIGLEIHRRRNSDISV